MKTRSHVSWLSLPIAAVLVFAASFSQAGQTIRTSVDSAGVPGDGRSIHPVTSASGRFVAYDSGSTNLVAGDINGVQDIFVRDQLTGTTIRVSVDSGGNEADAPSNWPAISADGRFVAFESFASNLDLVTSDVNGVADIYLHDTVTGETVRVSVGLGGEANDTSNAPAISADGRYVAFHSLASNLVAGDTNLVQDVFVYDRLTGLTTRVSRSSTGAEGDGDSLDPAISADGRYVAFSSIATNLVQDDTNGFSDIFLRDRSTGKTTLVSVGPGGVQGDENSYFPVLNATGRYVAYSSDASSLVPGDTNILTDIFMFDRNNGTTSLISSGVAGAPADGPSSEISISSGGRYVSFGSTATNLVAGDVNGQQDVFVRDRTKGTTSLASLNSIGGQGNNSSYDAMLSADGRYTVFASRSTNLAVPDTNNNVDTFFNDRMLIKYWSADVAVAVTSEPTSVANGATGSYTITVTNNGPRSVSDVSLTNVSSATPVSLTPSQGSCNRSMVSVCGFGPLASGASATLTVVMKGASPGPLTQQISVGAAPRDTVPANNYTSVSTPVTP